MAACTIPVAIADPAANARTVLEQARACHDDGVAVAVFPELTLCGYSVDDLFLQDTLLEAVEAAVAEIAAGSVDLVPVLVVGAPLVHGTRVLNCAVVIHRGRVLGVVPEVLPADLPGVLRAALVRARGRPARVVHHDSWSRPASGRAVRARPDLRGDGPARPQAARRGLRGHVGADPAERGGGAGRRDRAREPVGQPDHGGPRGGPAAAGAQRQRPLQRGVPLRRRGPGRVDHRPVLGRPDDGLRVRRPARRERALPRGPAALGRRRRPRPDPPGAAAAGHVRRQPADVRRARAGVPDRAVRAARADRRHRAAPQGRPLPVRARRRRAARARLLRGLQHPGLRPRAAAARDRPAQGRDRRQRWPRLHPRADRGRQGDGPARPAAQRHPRVHDAGLRHGGDHEVLRHPAREVAGRDLRGARHHRRGRPDAGRPRPPVRRGRGTSTT